MKRATGLAADVVIILRDKVVGNVDTEFLMTPLLATTVPAKGCLANRPVLRAPPPRPFSGLAMAMRLMPVRDLWARRRNTS